MLNPIDEFIDDDIRKMKKEAIQQIRDAICSALNEQLSKAFQLENYEIEQKVLWGTNWRDIVFQPFVDAIYRGPMQGLQIV